jgi:hypothetical protein
MFYCFILSLLMFFVVSPLHTAIQDERKHLRTTIVTLQHVCVCRQSLLLPCSMFVSVARAYCYPPACLCLSPEPIVTLQHVCVCRQSLLLPFQHVCVCRQSLLLPSSMFVSVARAYSVLTSRNWHRALTASREGNVYLALK